MFALSDANRFFLYPYPTDMHKSFYSLSGIVTNSMGMDVRNGDAFIFVNRYQAPRKLRENCEKML